MHSAASGEPNHSSSQLSKDLTERWKAMTQAKKEAATLGAVEELKVQREMKALAMQNTRLSAFHDARTNLDAIEDEVCAYLLVEYFI